jgi:hypothetical protein
MTSRDFCYWLQGYLEIVGARDATATPNALNENQVRCVHAHLAMVFVHEIDPSMGGPKEQAKLDALHETIESAKTPHGLDLPGDIKYRC